MIKIGKKGQLTIPQALLKAAGIPNDSHVTAEVTADCAIVLRQVAVYPMEAYSEARISEFAAANSIPAAIERRVQIYLKKFGPNR